MNFKKYYYFGEAVAKDEIPTKPQSKPAVFFNGRFSVVTKAHANIMLDMMKKYRGAHPVVYIVKGKKSSLDKKKNPLNFEQQKDLIIKSTRGKVKDIRMAPDSFIGTFIKDLRNDGYEPVGMFAGTDRIKSYKGQVDRLKDDLNLDLKVNEIKRTGEDISATKVRDAIRGGDFNTFKKMTSNLDKKDFAELQELLKL